LQTTNIRNRKERVTMTRKRRNVVIAGIVLFGFACMLYLIPSLNNSAHMTVAEGSEVEVLFQERLLEYVEFGLYFDDELNGFFYNEQRVKRLVDAPSLFQYDDGVVEVKISRDSEGNISDFIVN